MNVSEILQKAKEEGEVFLASLSPEQLKKSGFEEDKDFWNFEYVDIYLIYSNEFKIKYVFDGDPSNTLYETEKDIGGYDYFLEVINAYLKASK
jgi:hypothetical protein